MDTEMKTAKIKSPCQPPKPKRRRHPIYWPEPLTTRELISFVKQIEAALRDWNPSFSLSDDALKQFLMAAKKLNKLEKFMKRRGFILRLMAFLLFAGALNSHAQMPDERDAAPKKFLSLSEINARDLRNPAPDINPRHYGQSVAEPAVVTPPADIVIPIAPMPGVEHAYVLSATDPSGPWIERDFADITILSNGDWQLKPTPAAVQEFYKVLPCETDN